MTSPSTVHFTGKSEGRRGGETLLLSSPLQSLPPELLRHTCPGIILAPAFGVQAQHRTPHAHRGG